MYKAKPPKEGASQNPWDGLIYRRESDMSRSVLPLPAMSISRRSLSGFDAIIRTLIPNKKNLGTAEPATQSRTIPERGVPIRRWVRKEGGEYTYCCFDSNPFSGGDRGVYGLMRPLFKGTVPGTYRYESEGL